MVTVWKKKTTFWPELQMVFQVEVTSQVQCTYTFKDKTTPRELHLLL